MLDTYQNWVGAIQFTPSGVVALLAHVGKNYACADGEMGLFLTYSLFKRRGCVSTYNATIKRTNSLVVIRDVMQLVNKRAKPSGYKGVPNTRTKSQVDLEAENNEKLEMWWTELRILPKS